ncbi:hypothetical protein LCGC14_0949770, partial [marine sediment metagenome]
SMREEAMRRGPLGTRHLGNLLAKVRHGMVEQSGTGRMINLATGKEAKHEPFIGRTPLGRFFEEQATVAGSLLGDYILFKAGSSIVKGLAFAKTPVSRGIKNLALRRTLSAGGAFAVPGAVHQLATEMENPAPIESFDDFASSIERTIAAGAKGGLVGAAVGLSGHIGMKLPGGRATKFASAVGGGAAVLGTSTSIEQGEFSPKAYIDAAFMLTGLHGMGMLGNEFKAGLGKKGAKIDFSPDGGTGIEQHQGKWRHRMSNQLFESKEEAGKHYGELRDRLITVLDKNPTVTRETITEMMKTDPDAAKRLVSDIGEAISGKLRTEYEAGGEHPSDVVLREIVKENTGMQVEQLFSAPRLAGPVVTEGQARARQSHIARGDKSSVILARSTTPGGDRWRVSTIDSTDGRVSKISDYSTHDEARSEFDSRVSVLGIPSTRIRGADTGVVETTGGGVLQTEPTTIEDAAAPVKKEFIGIKVGGRGIALRDLPREVTDFRPGDPIDTNLARAIQAERGRDPFTRAVQHSVEAEKGRAEIDLNEIAREADAARKIAADENLGSPGPLDPRTADALLARLRAERGEEPPPPEKGGPPARPPKPPKPPASGKPERDPYEPDAGDLMKMGMTEVEARRVEAATKKRAEVHRDSIELKRRNDRVSWNSMKEWFGKNIINPQYTIEEILAEFGEQGLQTKMHLRAARGATPYAESLSAPIIEEVWRGTSRSKADLINEIVLTNNWIAISKDPRLIKKGIKHPRGLTLQELEDSLAGRRAANPVEFDDAARRANILSNAVRALTIDPLRDAGIIDSARHARLAKRKDHMTRQFLDAELDPAIYQITDGGKTISVRGSGIPVLKGGSENLLDPDVQSLFRDMVNRTQSRIFRNSPNKAGLQLALEKPDNPLFRLSVFRSGKHKGKPFFQTKKGRVFPKVPKDKEQIGVMVDGQQWMMEMPKEFARDWITADPVFNSATMVGLRWMSSAQVTRAFATGTFNPLFFLTNFPRDIIYTWIRNPDLYSPHLPIAATQLFNDLNAVARDTWAKGPSYQDAMAQGFGQAFLFKQGQLRMFQGRTGRALDSAQKTSSHANEFFEMWTRMAVRNRVISMRTEDFVKQKGRQPNQAELKRIEFEGTARARDVIDFAVGGRVTKAMDTVMPYLAAGIRGTVGIVEAAKANPAMFGWKVAQLMGLSASITLYNMLTNEEAFDSTSDELKNANFIFTTPYFYLDENGQKRYVEFKIAKDHGQRVFSAVAEMAMEGFAGKTIDKTRLLNAAQDSLNITPVSWVPPVAKGLFAYTFNKDMFFNEDIWKGPDVKPSAEIDDSVNPIYNYIAANLGLSPKRTQAALSQVVSRGNVFMSAIGQGTRYLIEEPDPGEMSKTTMQVLATLPGVRSVVSVTHPAQFQRNMLEREAMDDNTIRYQANRVFDPLAQRYFNAPSGDNFSAVIDFINTQPLLDRDRLVSRFRSSAKLQGLDNRSFWLSLLDMPGPAAARSFYSIWDDMDTNGKRHYESTARKVMGESTDFWATFFKLRAGKSDITVRE